MRLQEKGCRFYDPIIWRKSSAAVVWVTVPKTSGIFRRPFLGSWNRFQNSTLSHGVRGPDFRSDPVDRREGTCRLHPRAPLAVKGWRALGRHLPAFPRRSRIGIGPMISDSIGDGMGREIQIDPRGAPGRRRVSTVTRCALPRRVASGAQSSPSRGKGGECGRASLTRFS